jgi:hypothetical protein
MPSLGHYIARIDFVAKPGCDARNMEFVELERIATAFALYVGDAVWTPATLNLRSPRARSKSILRGRVDSALAGNGGQGALGSLAFIGTLALCFL